MRLTYVLFCTQQSRAAVAQAALSQFCTLPCRRHMLVSVPLKCSCCFVSNHYCSTFAFCVNRTKACDTTSHCTNRLHNNCSVDSEVTQRQLRLKLFKTKGATVHTLKQHLDTVNKFAVARLCTRNEVCIIVR
jgi:hypothetical protein